MFQGDPVVIVALACFIATRVNRTLQTDELYKNVVLECLSQDQCNILGISLLKAILADGDTGCREPLCKTVYGHLAFQEVTWCFPMSF